MSNVEGTCRWQDCSRPAVWGSEFCFLHRPSGGDVFTSTVCAVAKWAGTAAAGAVLIHLLKLIPHIGIIFNEQPDLVSALANPSEETLSRAISLLAETESKQSLSCGASSADMGSFEFRIDSSRPEELLQSRRGKGAKTLRMRGMEKLR